MFQEQRRGGAEQTVKRGGERVIFLDIDGVMSVKSSSDPDSLPPLDSEAVNILNKLCEETGAKVVITSAWREVFPGSDFLAHFQNAGFNGEFHRRWRTPTAQAGVSASEKRGEEVLTWLSHNPTASHWVAFDDIDAFSGASFPRGNLVMVQGGAGLNESYAQKAKRLLD